MNNITYLKIIDESARKFQEYEREFVIILEKLRNFDTMYDYVLYHHPYLFSTLRTNGTFKYYFNLIKKYNPTLKTIEERDLEELLSLYHTSYPEDNDDDMLLLEPIERRPLLFYEKYRVEKLFSNNKKEYTINRKRKLFTTISRLNIFRDYSPDSGIEDED